MGKEAEVRAVLADGARFALGDKAACGWTDAILDPKGRIGELVPRLDERGALWVVSLKGRLAKARDVEVMAAAKAVGLVDNKVCAFSDTRTALRFMRRRG